MSASRVLALATLFLATTFAQAEWKEFTFPDGNFKVVFPESPQRLRGIRRNLDQFSATAGAETYGLAYADYSPRSDWESAVDGKRDSIVRGLGAFVVDEKRTSVRRVSREMDSFCRTEYERRTRHLPRRAPVVLAARICSEEYSATAELF